MKPRKIRSFVDSVWEQDIVPQLVDYIRIPNKSPAFDRDWQRAGHMKRAVDLIAGWCRSQPIEGLTVEVVELDGRGGMRGVHLVVERDRLQQPRHRVVVHPQVVGIEAVARLE